MVVVERNRGEERGGGGGEEEGDYRQFVKRTLHMRDEDVENCSRKSELSLLSCLSAFLSFFLFVCVSECSYQ